jgi:hypothetical protein
MPFTQNTCHVGKSRKPNLDMRSRYMGKCRLTAGAFYPELGGVGKDVIKKGISRYKPRLDYNAKAIYVADNRVVTHIEIQHHFRASGKLVKSITCRVCAFAGTTKMRHYRQSECILF